MVAQLLAVVILGLAACLRHGQVIEERDKEVAGLNHDVSALTSRTEELASDNYRLAVDLDQVGHLGPSDALALGPPLPMPRTRRTLGL